MILNIQDTKYIHYTWWHTIQNTSYMNTRYKIHHIWTHDTWWYTIQNIHDDTRYKIYMMIHDDTDFSSCWNPFLLSKQKLIIGGSTRTPKAFTFQARKVLLAINIAKKQKNGKKKYKSSFNKKCTKYEMCKKSFWTENFWLSEKPVVVVRAVI